jgi:nitrate reductase molybdenum cofactor assembly chaperone NarJ/NarW
MNRCQLAATYNIISELFLYPEDRDMARIDADFAALEGSPELLAPIEAFLASPSSVSVEEYVSTLELTPLVPLHLGSYLFEEPESCRGAGMSGRNGYMLELNNIYRHFGVEFAGKEMSDFVPVVVEFLGLSLDRKDMDRIGLRRYFVETLLVNAIECLMSALRKAESPYQHLIEALRVALTEDITQMASGPIWQAPKDEDLAQVPDAVREFLTHKPDAIENGPEL